VSVKLSASSRRFCASANPKLLVLETSMPALYRQVFAGGPVDVIAADPPCDLLVIKP
jgi:hypothetical protein